ncbi:MAG: hypothetical protein K8R06_09625 [Methanosarcinales archaeon]|nr:hypothetical protein [Methanosarcinales archaeon]
MTASEPLHPLPLLQCIRCGSLQQRQGWTSGQVQEGQCRGVEIAGGGRVNG